MELGIIAAIASNGIIGRNGTLPWDSREVPGDLRRFKQLTVGHPVIMGRKTYDSILQRNGSALPKRLNIVLTRSGITPAQSTYSFRNLGDSLDFLESSSVPGFDYSRAFVIGGEEVYRLAIPRADFMELTEIERPYDGDARFPDFDRAEWAEQGREDHKGFSFVTYRRSI